MLDSLWNSYFWPQNIGSRDYLLAAAPTVPAGSDFVLDSGSGQTASEIAIWTVRRARWWPVGKIIPFDGSSSATGRRSRDCVAETGRVDPVEGADQHHVGRAGLVLIVHDVFPPRT
jgi:hypothetical protein